MMLLLLLLMLWLLPIEFALPNTACARAATATSWAEVIATLPPSPSVSPSLLSLTANETGDREEAWRPVVMMVLPSSDKQNAPLKEEEVENLGEAATGQEAMLEGCEEDDEGEVEAEMAAEPEVGEETSTRGLARLYVGSSTTTTGVRERREASRLIPPVVCCNGSEEFVEEAQATPPAAETNG